MTNTEKRCILWVYQSYTLPRKEITMKKQTVKRVNVFLTQRELNALEEISKKYPEENMSDIIRTAILELCRIETGITC